MMVRIGWRLLLVAAMGVLVATGCGGGNGQQSQHGVEEERHEQSSGSTVRGEDLDRAFIRGMVPHHQGAVEMAKVEREKGQRAEVKELAQSIIDAQEREMAEMGELAKRKFGFTPEREHHGAMGMLMGVPISTDMAMMRQHVVDASDTDTAFLTMMRPHHAGAIVMADEEMNNGGDADLKRIAEKIVADQAKELGRIQELLTRAG